MKNKILYLSLGKSLIADIINLFIIGMSLVLYGLVTFAFRPEAFCNASIEASSIRRTNHVYRELLSWFKVFVFSKWFFY